jgi:endonuclease YncB( thermonuclease family)
MIYKLSVFLFLLFFCTESSTYKVIGIQDGDSLTLLSSDKWPLKVRLEGIDCPEKNQAFGNKAKQYLSDLCFEKNITLKQSGKDRYGRTLGWLYTADGKCINLLMIQQGLAWHYKKYSKDSTLAKAELEARSKKINIWSEALPIAPWEFRHPKKINP